MPSIKEHQGSHKHRPWPPPRADPNTDMTAARRESSDIATHAREGRLSEDNQGLSASNGGESASQVEGRPELSEEHRKLAAMTRDDLYDKARDLGIAGRSRMTKAQLVDAVRAHLS